MPVPRSFVAALLLVVLTACGHRTSASQVSASPATASASRGSVLFAANCAACHGANGVGGRIGPALHDEKRRTSPQQVRAAIVDPQPPMPKLYPGQFTDQDVNDVTAYVESL